jgi:hypothetical protein
MTPTAFRTKINARQTPPVRSMAKSKHCYCYIHGDASLAFRAQDTVRTFYATIMCDIAVFSRLFTSFNLQKFSTISKPTLLLIGYAQSASTIQS